jgi:hypothetical protein
MIERTPIFNFICYITAGTRHPARTPALRHRHHRIDA